MYELEAHINIRKKLKPNSIFKTAMIIFPITDKKKEFQLGYGLYGVYFTGGFSIENLDLLDIHLYNSETKETITLKEKTNKSRDYINNQKAIYCYEFQINEFGNFTIELQNPEVLTIKNGYNNPFSILKFIIPNRTTEEENINLVIK